MTFIETYGGWMRALQKGELVPCSEDQKTFIHQVNNNVELTFEPAKIWKKYLRKEWEEQNPQFVNAPPVTAKDESFGTREEFKI